MDYIPWPNSWNGPCRRHGRPRLWAPVQIWATKRFAIWLPGWWWCPPTVLWPSIDRVPRPVAHYDCAGRWWKTRSRWPAPICGKKRKKKVNEHVQFIFGSQGRKKKKNKFRQVDGPCLIADEAENKFQKLVKLSNKKEEEKIPPVFSVETEKDPVSFPFDERGRAGLLHVAKPASWNTAVDDNRGIFTHDRVLRFGRKHQILIASCWWGQIREPKG